MALPVALTVRPTVDTQGTPLQVGVGITQSNLIRIKNGYAQKLGGSTVLYPAAFTLSATAIFPYGVYNSAQGRIDNIVAIGAWNGAWTGVFGQTKLFAVTNGASADITPAAPGAPIIGFWSLSAWGSLLLASMRFGAVYQWAAGAGAATQVAGSPQVSLGTFVAAPQQQAFAWGAYSVALADLDPLLLRWCDISNLVDWIPSATNQAGSFRLTSGSSIVAGTWVGLTGLLWTDLDLWTFNYIGFPLVYGFNKLAPNVGLIAPKAFASLGNLMAWMGQNDFFSYQGGNVTPLECTVRDFIFNNLDRNFFFNIHADANTYFNEITWRFPMTGSAGVCNGYVKWSPGEKNAWDYGSGDPKISAWADQSAVGAPIGSDYTFNVQQFETAIDFAGAALNPFFLTGWFQIAEGETDFFVERVMPDFVLSSGGSVLMTFYFADEVPSDDSDYPVRTYGPFTVTAATPYIIVRGRGRVMRMRVESTAANTFWRYGKPLAKVTVDGKGS